ncbi:uncharacterized protein [Physcomitrium patens]|uniref:uncharacterized protein isoform X3 n=1 Tax=Physcomitrium patens TaxID=3218 RepID=UPI003CCE1242
MRLGIRIGTFLWACYGGTRGEGMDGLSETVPPEVGALKSRTGELAADGNIIEREEKEKECDGDKEEIDEKKMEVESRPGKWFRLTGSCTLALHRGDITKWSKDGRTDAIVNAANEMMLGGGGVDGAIHRAAGRKLYEACMKVPEVSRGVRCPVGSAVITPGFKLPVSRVIHTVGPMYHKEADPAFVLSKAYKKSISVAKKDKVKHIAFPAISCGIYGYPYEEAAKVSIQALRETAGDLLEVHFVLFEQGTYNAWLAEAEKKLESLTRITSSHHILLLQKNELYKRRSNDEGRIL